MSVFVPSSSLESRPNPPPNAPLPRPQALHHRADAAARRISRAWRRYLLRRAFLVARDRIARAERRDPVAVIRAVNPAESVLADAAAGVLVRFRLGGEEFPPTVYYRIHTSRPVADVCALAPRDYAAARARAAKRASRRCASRTGTPSPEPIGREYEREDGNDWRPVSARALEDFDARARDVDPRATIRASAFARARETARNRRRFAAGGSRLSRLAAPAASRRRGRAIRGGGLARAYKMEKPRDIAREDEASDGDDELEGLLRWSAALDVASLLGDDESEPSGNGYAWRVS